MSLQHLSIFLVSCLRTNGQQNPARGLFRLNITKLGSSNQLTVQQNGWDYASCAHLHKV